MANYKGQAFTLKVGTWAGGTEVGDCMAHTLTINNEQVEITNKSSNFWRTLLEGAGVKAVDISISGVVSNGTGYETFQGYAISNSINTMSMGWADGDTMEGAFAITSLEITGEHNGAQTFTASLQSSGAPTFTQA